MEKSNERRASDPSQLYDPAYSSPLSSNPNAIDREDDDSSSVSDEDACYGPGKKPLLLKFIRKQKHTNYKLNKYRASKLNFGPVRKDNRRDGTGTGGAAPSSSTGGQATGQSSHSRRHSEGSSPAPTRTSWLGGIGDYLF